MEYIVYQKPKSTKPKKIEMNRAPPNLTENEGDIESEYVQNYTIETEENEEVKSLITENLIPFVEEEEYQEPEEISDPEETEKIKVWRPKFQGSKVPMKVFLDKAEEYKKEPDSESNNDLIGYLAYNGFVDVGVNKNHEKQVVTSAEGVSSVSRDTLMDEDAMIETVKAFQKFNGFPETGELTEEEAKVISLPKCGNRDTSYKDEIDTFTCIEAINEMQSNNKREPCDLDSDSFLDICSKFPDDHLQSDEMIDKFVWRKGFFFEVDVDFRKSGKPNSHVGIAFNYEDSNRTSEYIFVQYEKVNKRLVFSYGTITKGKREPMKSLSNFGTHIKLDSYQRKYRQFKLRLTVGSEKKRTASVSLNGRRIFTFNTILPTKSSVYLFTLGGSHYIDHNVRAFTARICRRNLANDRQEEPGSEVVRRRKRWSQTNFRWYPNGASITYAFINYSTELGELATRTVIEEALKAFASHGFQFEELNPFAAHNADIVFMFIRDGTHVDGKVFDGPSTEKAHAYVPVHGEIHFNDYEIFSAEQGTEAGGRTSLKYVAMHEIGHAMGIGHSDVQNAVMAKNYPGDSAFNVADLDEDDVTALSAQYSEIVADVPDPSVISQDYSSIQGIQNMLYEQRMPLPSSCLDRIDAAFYFYDRDTSRQQDLFYLMSFGYVWAYDSITNVLQDGYPKRLSSVFYGAPGEIDAAFDTGTRIFLISGQNVYIYTISYDQITFHSQDTLTNLFSITEPVSAAFNHRKTVCSTGSDTSCIGTTLVIDENKYFEIVWKKYGKVVARSSRGNSAEIIGKEFSSNLFGASFEYTKADGSSEVMIFQKIGRTLRSRVFFPGDAYEERTTWSDVPAAFSIVGWCVG